MLQRTSPSALRKVANGNLARKANVRSITASGGLRRPRHHTNAADQKVSGVIAWQSTPSAPDQDRSRADQRADVPRPTESERNDRPLSPTRFATQHKIRKSS